MPTGNDHNKINVLLKTHKHQTLEELKIEMKSGALSSETSSPLPVRYLLLGWPAYKVLVPPWPCKHSPCTLH